MGRPTKLNAELIAAICHDLESGCPIETAAQANGIHPATIWRWLDTGAEDSESIYGEFCEAVARTRARVELRLLRRVAGEEEDPQLGAFEESENVTQVLRSWHDQRAKGAAWILERTRPRQYSQRVNMKVSEALSEAMEVVRGICAPEDFQRICERLANGAGEGGEPLPRALPAQGHDLDS